MKTAAGTEHASGLSESNDLSNNNDEMSTTTTTKARRRRTRSVARSTQGQASGPASQANTERRAVILVKLLKTIYGDPREGLERGTWVRVEGGLTSRLQVEISPISQPGRRICVSRFTEVSAIGPDCTWDSRSMELLMLARVASNKGKGALHQAVMRHWFRHHQRRGMREIASPGWELVPYAGGAQ